VLQRIADAGLLKGKTIGIDATTLEANAALRSIVRRDTGDSYQEFLTKLAKDSAFILFIIGTTSGLHCPDKSISCRPFSASPATSMFVSH